MSLKLCQGRQNVVWMFKAQFKRFCSQDEKQQQHNAKFKWPFLQLPKGANIKELLFCYQRFLSANSWKKSQTNTDLHAFLRE